MKQLEKLSGETRLYPIIGDLISFVKSPHRLTAKFEELGHNGICVPMLVPEGALESVVRGLDFVPNVRGLLITTPCPPTAPHLLLAKPVFRYLFPYGANIVLGSALQRQYFDARLQCSLMTVAQK